MAAKKSGTPKNFSSPLKCGHCSNVGPHEIIASYEDKKEIEDSFGQTEDWGTTYEILVCPACRKVVLRSWEWGPWTDQDNPPTEEVLFPAPARQPVGLPNAVALAFDSATKVRNIDPNAFGVLLGRVLDVVCADRKAKGKTLSEKLSDLARKGEMPQKLADLAHALRGLRNYGAHADLGELTRADVPVLEDLCRAVLEYIYGAPALLARVQKHLDRLKSRKADAKKRG